MQEEHECPASQRGIAFQEGRRIGGRGQACFPGIDAVGQDDHARTEAQACDVGGLGAVERLEEPRAAQDQRTFDPAQVGHFLARLVLERPRFQHPLRCDDVGRSPRATGERGGQDGKIERGRDVRRVVVARMHEQPAQQRQAELEFAPTRPTKIADSKTVLLHPAIRGNVHAPGTVGVGRHEVHGQPDPGQGSSETQRDLGRPAVDRTQRRDDEQDFLHGLEGGVGGSKRRAVPSALRSRTANSSRSNAPSTHGGCSRAASTARCRFAANRFWRPAFDTPPAGFAHRGERGRMQVRPCVAKARREPPDRPAGKSSRSRPPPRDRARSRNVPTPARVTRRPSPR